MIDIPRRPESISKWDKAMNNKFSGVTLIEILLFIMLFILASCALIPFIFYAKDIKLSPKERKEQQNILLIKNALKFYKLDNGFYPTTTQGLDALINKPRGKPQPQHWTGYMDKIPVDQWNRAFEYINYDNDKNIEVFSCGPPREKQSWWYYIKHKFSVHAQYCKKRKLMNESSARRSQQHN